MKRLVEQVSLEPWAYSVHVTEMFNKQRATEQESFILCAARNNKDSSYRGGLDPEMLTQDSLWSGLTWVHGNKDRSLQNLSNQAGQPLRMTDHITSPLRLPQVFSCRSVVSLTFSFILQVGPQQEETISQLCCTWNRRVLWPDCPFNL